MSQSIRELLTELAWSEDSIRHVPLSSVAVGPDAAQPASGLNPDLMALAERERDIIAQLRAARTERPAEPTPA
jgi:hypothetical protein